MDRLWAAGWRHFGVEFFRYTGCVMEERWVHIQPLRLELAAFESSKSQRRVLRKNQDLRHEFVPASHSAEADALFQLHKLRFRESMPEGVKAFLSDEPAAVPCACVECRVWLGDELVALSYLDLGAEASSAVYGMFAPEHSQRSLGIYTMLLEMEHSRSLGMRYYYPGYATRESSAYDYKKQFCALEYLDWQTGLWLPLADR